MKKMTIASALLAVLAPGIFTSFLAAEPTGSTVIYGTDDRLDLYQVKSPELQKLADSTVGLFRAGDVAIAAGVAALKTDSYSESYKLCPEEPFSNQVTGAFCSGSLVAPDVIMTAGHCVKDASGCQNTRFVFGFGVKSEGIMPASVPEAEVYSCASLIGREQENAGADWALIKLDRPVLNHAPLKYNTANTLKNGDALLVIGHPAGLPTKVAGGAAVRDASPNGYFVANLDTYGGNSGSAVFNARTGLIEGILVRGENDYVWKGSCRVSNVCPDTGCRGEDITKLSSVMSYFTGNKGPVKIAVEKNGLHIARTPPVFRALEALSASF